jgi:hypothetical protein
MIVKEAELVFLSRLPCEADASAWLNDIDSALPAQVGGIGPLARIASVEVVIQSGNVVVAPLTTAGSKEPQPVFQDRTAPRRVEVVISLSEFWRAQTDPSTLV